MRRNGASPRSAGKRGMYGNRSRRRSWMRPMLMALEERSLLSTINVNSTADSGPGSLRDAIQQANSALAATTIAFDSTTFLAPLTITLTSGPLVLSNAQYAESIIGPAAGLTISGGGSSRVFQVGATVNASISGLTITGGSTSGSGGGLANYGGIVSLTDCTISGNFAASGGGVYTQAYSTTTLTNCAVSGNSASGSGGGLFDAQGSTNFYGGTLSGNSAADDGGGFANFVGAANFSNVTISGNTAASGGGMSILSGTMTLTNCGFSGDVASVSGGAVYNYGGTMTLTGCTISGESAAANGGGVYNTGYGTVSLTNCTVSGNSATSRGGGLANAGGATTNLDGTTVSGNTAADGGGVANLKGTTTLNNATITGNSAINGAGVYNDGGTANITGSSISDNSASGTGGGVLNHGGTTTLTNSVVSGNDAASAAGVGTYHYGTSTLTNCTISGNSASANGGGLSTNYSTTVLTGCAISGDTASNGGGLYTVNHGTTSATNCTISGNTAVTDGGGLYTASSGKTTLADATISANTAGVSGGGLFNQTGTVTLGNTIVAVNAAGSSGPDALGTVSSQGYNLVGATDGSSGWVPSDQSGTSTQPLNPLLSPLGSYGGTTQTMSLLPGSPAIDAGSNTLVPTGITTDQRGSSRVVDSTVDIGALESNLFTIAVTSGSGQSTPFSTSFPDPLVATVTANNPLEPVAGGLVTFTPPVSGASATLVGNPATISALGTVSVAATANGIVGGYTIPAGGQRHHQHRELRPDKPGDPDDRHHAQPNLGHTGVVAGDLEGHGGPRERLPGDRRHHVHALSRRHARIHRGGIGQRRRHLHDTRRLHPADHGHRDGHLSVGCQLCR